MIRTLRDSRAQYFCARLLLAVVLIVSAMYNYKYKRYHRTYMYTLFARFACSARGGGYTIRTLRVLSASVAASASYTIRTLTFRVLSASAAASYTVLHCSHASRAQGSAAPQR